MDVLREIIMVLVGKRIQTNAEGWLPDLTEPGTFGCATHPRIKNTFGGWWNVCAPDGSVVELNPSKHTVAEHEDGSISVYPSIVTKTWHGWLVAGVWSETRQFTH
jgi:hypothetical protein